MLGLVGESGSGKTTVGMALMGYCRPGGRVTGGEILIDGRPLAAMAAGELRRLRGGTVSYIPQDPGTALNPALRIGRQLSEMLEAHKSQTSAEDARPASARRWRRWRCPPTTSSCAATPISSPAASSSAWPSPWPSPAART